MGQFFILTRVFCALFFLLSLNLSAQFIDTSPRGTTPYAVTYKKRGDANPRNTRGTITPKCRRGPAPAVWDNYKAYLPPLGRTNRGYKHGWAKWDEERAGFIVCGGARRWLQPSYGNPAYPGGGGINLLNSMMTSPEGYAAWDRWVEALVTRYKDRVKEWEIWNEPDHPGQKITPETTAALNIRTASIIKRIQPEAKIAGLAFASNSNMEYLDAFLKFIAEQGKLDLFQWISYPQLHHETRGCLYRKKGFGLAQGHRNSTQRTSRRGQTRAPSCTTPVCP